MYTATEEARQKTNAVAIKARLMNGQPQTARRDAGIEQALAEVKRLAADLAIAKNEAAAKTRRIENMKRERDKLKADLDEAKSLIESMIELKRLSFPTHGLLMRLSRR